MLELGVPEWSAYEVHGTTLADVHAEISALPEAGSCDWSASSYDASWGDDGKVAEVTAVVRITVQMPAWVEEGQAPQEAQDEWQRFWRALRDHEQGHIDIVHARIAGVDERMIGEDEAGARRVWDAAFDEINAASKAYDDGNHHGQDEGTILDLDAGAPVESEGESSGSESSEGESSESDSSEESSYS
jgi:predicted secreted Zn-dependent protease